MKMIFAAAAITLFFGATAAHASPGFNGLPYNGTAFNGLPCNGTGYNGTSPNVQNENVVHGASCGPTVGSADLLSVELPR